MRTFPRLTPGERLRVALLHTLPTLARGVAIARPKTTALLNRLDVDRRMVELFDRLRDRYRGLPVWTNSIGRRTLLLLSPTHVERVLGGSDLLYTPDTAVKHRAFGTFQPDALPISRGRLRTERRRFNEAVLDSHATRPGHADRCARIVSAEIDALLTGPGRDGRLIWPELHRGFDQLARRVVLGDGARDDADTTRLLARLRHAANTAAITGRNRRRVAAWKADWDDRITRYAASAPADSLIGRVYDSPTGPRVHPLGQVTHWLLALDRVGELTARTLALLASHPEQFARANEELIAADTHHGPDTADAIAAQPYLGACVMEAARLWPAVADLSRVTTRPVDWDGVLLATATTLIVPITYHARSRHQGRSANHFQPDRWLDGGMDRDWTIMPFGRGPARCAGTTLATFLATAASAAILRRAYVRLNTPRLASHRPLPTVLPVADISFAVAAKPPVAAPITSATGAVPPGP